MPSTHWQRVFLSYLLYKFLSLLLTDRSCLHPLKSVAILSTSSSGLVGLRGRGRLGEGLVFLFFPEVVVECLFEVALAPVEILFDFLVSEGVVIDDVSELLKGVVHVGFN